METTRIKINGIVRDKAGNEFADGDCQEIINMRLRDNAWRPINPPEKIFNVLANEYDKIRIHVAEGIRNYIGIRSNSLYLIDMEAGTDTFIGAYAEGVDVQFIKRMMIVSGSVSDTYIWQNNAYQNVSLSLHPSIKIEEHGYTLTNAGNVRAAEALLGKFRAKVSEMSNDNYILGSFTYRFAWKLYDGSFVSHSIPGIIKSSGDNYTLARQSISGDDPYFIRQIYGRKLKATYTPAFTNVFDSLNPDIVTALCVFISKPEIQYQLDEDTITDEFLLLTLPSGIRERTLQQAGVALNTSVDNLADQQSWYLVKEIDIRELQGAGSIYSDDFDLKGFMSDYASRQTLPVDSFSHHKVYGNVSFVYNDRLILGGTTTVFGSPKIGTLSPLIWSNYTLHTETLGKVGFVLKTDNGEKRIYTDVWVKVWTDAGKYKVVITANFFGPYPEQNHINIIGYQDARATQLDVILSVGGNYRLFGSISLKKSKYDNYAYYHTEGFGNIILENTSLGDIVTIDPSTQLFDDNRVQVSELRNPFVYPARLSYQVGTGSIIAFGANTEPLSSGQFGQYPLIVFTSKGVWAMEQGQGDVIFAAISPVSGDVALNRDHIISVGNGVIFTTSRGVFALSGKQLAQISAPLEGLINTGIIANEQLKYFVDNANLVQMLAQLSVIPALDYISGARMGFDKINSELLISNQEYDYTYIYNFESNSWHKSGETYNLLVQDYPYLLAIDQNGVYNLGLHSDANHIPVLILTQPQSLTANEVFKKIERLALRCTIHAESARYFTLAVFASDDLRQWQLITGGQRAGEIQNILLSRSHGSAQYYIFLMCGSVSMDSNISNIDVSLSPRMNRKLRK